MQEKLFETAKPKPIRRNRMDDPTWEWVRDKLFKGVIGSHEQKRAGRILKALREKGVVSPVELDLRCERYRNKFSDMALTPEALLKHLDVLAEPTNEEAVKAAGDAKALQKRNAWLLERQKTKADIDLYEAQCKRTGHALNDKGVCWRCRKVAELKRYYGWE